MHDQELHQCHSAAQITAANDRTKIWVPEAGNPIAAFFSGGGSGEAPKFKETTFAELELEKASQATQQVLMGGLINIVMSFQMGIHFPLAIQLISGPLMLPDDPIVRKWFLDNVKPGEKLYGESLTRPGAAGGAPAAGAIAAGANASGAEAVVAAASAASPAAAPADAAGAALPAIDPELDEAIMAVWESKELLDVGVFEHLVAQVSLEGSRWGGSGGKAVGI